MGHAGVVHVDAPPGRRTTALAVALPSATVLLLTVMVAVRRSNYGAAAAFALGLLVTAAVGGVVAARRPGHPCGWLLVALTVFAAAAATGTGYVQESLAGEERYPFTTAVGWVTTWIAYPTVPAGVLLLLTFPSGRLPSARWRFVAGAIVLAAIGAALSSALMPGPLPIARRISNPMGVRRAGDLLEAINGVTGVAAAAVFVAVVARLVLRYRRATGVERDQLRTLAFALPVAAAGLLGAVIASGPLNEASFYFAVGGLTTVPVAIGWAVLRHGLFDIELLVNRALVYGSLTVVGGALYVAVVTALGRALRQSTDLGAAVVATAVVAVAFGPLRERLQRSADRLMYGQRADPYAALSQLGHRLEDAAAPEDALPLTAETLGRSLKLRAVTIDVRRDGAMAPAAVVWGEPGQDRGAERFDLVHGRELVGQLAVWPRPGEGLSGRDRSLLSDLCRPVAVVAHATAMRWELQASRQRLVTAREEERRRLRADLHDGLGPELAGVAFGLGAARNTLQTDRAAADALLLELQQQVRSTVTQIRSLVDGLAPSVEQLGVGEALRQGARRLCSSTTLDVTIDVPELPPLPAAVEMAAYRIAMEALTNVVRHAHARRCTIALQVGETLCLRVTDDGQGLPDTVVPGVGLTSMRQRAEELGGSWSIEPARGGGALVVARLPRP